MLPSFGFTASTEYPCLNNIYTRESGWRYNAENASGAYGIPQALPGSKMATAGADWATNPATQIKWGLGYIKDRYGSPCGRGRTGRHTATTDDSPGFTPLAALSCRRADYKQ